MFDFIRHAQLRTPALGTLPGALLCLTMLLGCGESDPSSTPNAQPEQAASDAQTTYPEPPPPLTSSTQILSGGWLLSGDGSDPQFDSIIIVRDGAIVGFGKRGSLDVPADSIGIDASGKWILPGNTEQLAAAFGQRAHDAPTQFAGEQLAPIAVGRSAELVLLNSNPLTDPQALDDVHAVMIEGELRVLPNDDS